MKPIQSINTRRALVPLALLAVITLPALAQAVPPVTTYFVSGTVTTVVAKDGSNVAIPGFDYTKITAAGISPGVAATATGSIMSLTPPVIPDATTALYDGANNSFTLGNPGPNQMKASSFSLNSGAAVLNDRLANAECLGLPAHDIFGFGGSKPIGATEPNSFKLDDSVFGVSGCAAAPAQKGFAVFLAAFTAISNPLSSTALPSTLTASQWQVKQIVYDLIDDDNGQRYTVTADATVATASVSTSVPALGGVAVGLLAAALTAMGAVLASRRRSFKA